MRKALFLSVAGFRSDPELCRDCGYLSYAEIDQTLKLKPSALFNATEILLTGFLESWNELIRQLLLRLLTGERAIVFTRTIPSREELRAKLESIDALGLYLHIPFCEQICPYCPYNKELYRDNLAERYVDAVKTEMDFYAEISGNKPITSLYIGGGTPTTMLDSGLGKIIGHLRERVQSAV